MEIRTYNNPAQAYVRGCYYTNWAQYRPGDGKYFPEDYLPGLCTHIFYAFAMMNTMFNIVKFEWNDEVMYKRVVKLREKQPALKILLSFGGWTFSDGNAGLLKTMASSKKNREKFINSALGFVRKYKFDGFDLDWEYPTSADKKNFAALVQEMGTVFHKEGLLLTAAVSASIQKIDAGYDVPALANSLDFVNIMTYDFHGAWESKTGFSSPLYERNGDKFSMSNAAEHWAKRGLPKNKIIIGLATYGRSWTLNNKNQHGVGAAGYSGTAGEFTREAGFQSYYEICRLLASGSGKSYFDEVQQVPYLVHGNQWIGYDDGRSFKIKIDWLKKSAYGGAFVWALDFDDFNGRLCPLSKGQTYPLLKLIANTLGGDGQTFPIPATKATVAPEITKKPDESATVEPDVDESIITPSVVTNPDGTIVCPASGLYPNPKSCEHYFSCDHGIAHLMQCPQGLMFNPSASVCDWPLNVQCAA